MLSCTSSGCVWTCTAKAVVLHSGARLRLDVYCSVTKRLLRENESTLKEKAGPSFDHVCPRENVNTKQVGPLLYREIKGGCGRFLAWLAIKWEKNRRSSVVLFGEAVED